MKPLISFFCLLLLVQQPMAQNLRKIVDLKGQWKFSIGDSPRWARPDYRDGDWEQIQVPSAWENEGFSGFDGYAWYRLTLDLKNLTERNLYLVLGYIDDVDEVYLNGHLIGFTGSFPPNFYTAYHSHRQYYLPPDLLNKNGRNVIAVRVYDTVLDGGIIKGDVGIYTNPSEPQSTYSLEGIWKFREGDSQYWKELDYKDESWNDLIVPGFWRSMKDKHITGTAWYRKTFNLPDYLETENELVLVAGLIDDFDETYLNGQLIGTTNDGLPFGLSGSFRELRVYTIPKGLLNPSEPNVLAVRVRDIGRDAGIYAGPLAIIPRRDLRQLLSAR